MRTMLIAICQLFLLSTAFAGPREDAVRDAAYAMDTAALEAQFTEAHQSSLNGEITYDELRDMMKALAVSHPQIIAAVDQWLIAAPNSPYAHTARAVQLSATARGMRGIQIASRTPRDAMLTYAELQGRSMEYAISAYQAAPDFVPASDQVLRLQPVTKTFGQFAFLQLVSDVFEVTPNIGTFSALSLSTFRGWGGGGINDVNLLCEEHASKVPEPWFTLQVCKIKTANLQPGNIDYDKLWNDLGDAYHESLAFERAWYLTRPGSDDRLVERAFIEDYLRGVGHRQYFIAERYVKWSHLFGQFWGSAKM